MDHRQEEAKPQWEEPKPQREESKPRPEEPKPRPEESIQFATSTAARRFLQIIRQELLAPAQRPSKLVGTDRRIRLPDAGAQAAFAALRSGRMETFWAPMQGESTGWIELDLGKVSKFNVLEIREPVNMGQRVMEYHVEAWDSELGWYLVSSGSTIGYRKVDRLEEDQECAARLIRLLIDVLRGDPLICFFGLYFDTYSLRHLSSI
ncbi:hypothetical protein SELMODRAFT_431526 [Selaginella moellendorffii]|uniref:F5/8 type C domain-containing protein n=1 Tax=Selaginella moellendorffii TaxID=88036 RepID=D8TCY4_SELML|nr:hypothetical protein SELMODRAFT_431526 [Selaginella moellendorffii]